MSTFERDGQKVELSLQDDGRSLRVARSEGSGPATVEESSFVSPIRARWEHDRTVKQLLDAGFVQTETEADAERLDEDALTRFLDEGDEIDPEAALVYADFLSLADDPRGELIALQHRLRDRLLDAERKPLRDRETLLLFQHRHRLLGALGTRLIDEHRQRYAIDELMLEWSMGFIASARTRRDYHAYAEDNEVHLRVSELLALLAASPSARFLRQLRVRPILASDRDDAVRALETVSLPRSLREVVFGGIVDEYGRQRVDTPTECDLDAFLRRQPHLRRLDLDGMVPTQLEGHEALETLVLRSDPLSLGALRAVAEARWPALTSLTLGRFELGPDHQPFIHAFVVLVRSMPKLTSLRIEGPRAGTVLSWVLNGPFLETARELSVVEARLSASTVQNLVSASAQLSKLSRLDLSNNWISEADRRLLAQRLPNAKLLPRAPADDGDGSQD